MQRVRVNEDIKDDNQRNEKIEVPQARALRVHKGCDIAAFHVDIAIYLQGRQHRELPGGGGTLFLHTEDRAGFV